MSGTNGRGRGRGPGGTLFGRAVVGLVLEEIAARLDRIGVIGGTTIPGSAVVGPTTPPAGTPVPAELVDDAGVVLVDDDGVVLVASTGVASADHTHPEYAGGGGGGGAPSGPAGGDLSGTYPNPQIAAGVITDLDVHAANKDGAAGTPSLRTLSTTATSAAAGDHAHALAATESLLTNGGMEVWQRGNGPFTGIAAYTADRWQLSLVGGSTASVSRDSANADAGSLYCAAVAYTHVAASRLLQVVEPWAQLRWRTVTFAVRVRTATASAVRLSVWDSVNGFRYSADHTGSGGYELLAVTAPIGAGATGVQVSVDLDASCTAYVDDATLVVGSAVLPYVPLHPADELGRCQRYYQEIGGQNVYEVVAMGFNYGTTVGFAFLQFALEMGGTPTVTVSAPGDWAVFDATATVRPCTVLASAVVTARSCRLAHTIGTASLAAGHAAMLFANNTLAARIRAEWNPP